MRTDGGGRAGAKIPRVWRKEAQDPRCLLVEPFFQANPRKTRHVDVAPWAPLRSDQPSPPFLRRCNHCEDAAKADGAATRCPTRPAGVAREDLQRQRGPVA